MSQLRVGQRQQAAEGVLVAPFIQGIGVLSALARRRQLPLRSHNSFDDFFSRHPGWGISQAVSASWQESLAAEIHRRPGTGKSIMPIIQGGKHPDGLPDYRRAVGSDDYMMIVASWVDCHPDGLEAAARHFREAIDRQPAPSEQQRLNVIARALG